ncbi:hypothetical protein LC2W_2799 [Lacticaseibacillus paracasei]|nr:hypothetical protein LC2W_2799 [Lacticaseibacillus paracasei]EPC20837.1 hypothetical protein Lpp226_1110 [Lacticaseibacillus paracasei subsp. paracasei Lpp226]EPC29669.1 hypothetical protein Lpp120_2531 [Lacticaseibacillus paracasei subsp. paracasei Lpp120]EPC33997.1 hypothetical protein Lpp223_1268 [Lacticaseibacillus paracasei subsp. paracasei Lpp223]AEA58318.1 Hypothetical cytosolic protein [Lacticaseibacillus paracasei]
MLVGPTFATIEDGKRFYERETARLEILMQIGLNTMVEF